jgi:hypothetical protein
VVPIAVIGTRQVMPKSRLRTEPADVTVDRSRSDSGAGDRAAHRARCQKVR